MLLLFMALALAMDQDALPGRQRIILCHTKQAYPGFPQWGDPEWAKRSLSPERPCHLIPVIYNAEKRRYERAPIEK